MKRDSKRAALYAAENTLGEMFAPDLGDAPTLADCQAFIDAALRRRFARRLWPRWGATVGETRGGMTFATGAHIYLGRGTTRSRMLLLHELAHVLTPNDPGHGRAFARVYLLLVRHMLGRDVAARLRRAFVAHGVKYRSVSNAQRENGRRLAASHGFTVAAKLAPINTSPYRSGSDQ